MYTAFDPINGVTASYVALCVRTASPLEGRANLLHATLGIADETLEIDELFEQESISNESLVKELGDLLWFTALYCEWEAQQPEQNTTADAEFKQLMDNAVVEEQIDFNSIAGRAISLTKKEFAYKKMMDLPTRRQLFQDAVSMVVSICQYNALLVQDVLDRNIAKLSARYKKATFSQEEAINRDESKE